MIFDTHAHYDDKAFDKDRGRMLEHVHANGVSEIINVGASSKGAEDSVELAKKYPFVYAAVGIHPDEVGELDEEKCADSDSCVMKKNSCRRGNRIGLLLE